jgi:hypothetical protein
LLHIEPGDGHLAIRLVDNLPISSIKWAALSYVWGGNQEVKTTSSCLSAMMMNISVENLPQTLTDALMVCKKLWLRYIWIDCLCIVQDDGDDLTRELANRHRIYQQAWVTIAAATAHNVSQGFLHNMMIPSGDADTTLLPWFRRGW